MENRINYQKRLEQQLSRFTQEGRTPSLLLHSCCAPCSSYVLEYLSQAMAITVFYGNSNIYPPEEYHKRAAEQRRFLEALPVKNPVQFREGLYEPARFYEIAKGMEALPEGGERCFACYELRMRETAAQAKAEGFDYFTTTLSISPYKNAEKLNEIGERLGQELGVGYLYADFKKKDGYKRSIALSAEYGLYRQDYCGCIYSYQEAERRKREG